VQTSFSLPGDGGVQFRPHACRRREEERARERSQAGSQAGAKEKVFFCNGASVTVKICQADFSAGPLQQLEGNKEVGPGVEDVAGRMLFEGDVDGEDDVL